LRPRPLFPVSHFPSPQQNEYFLSFSCLLWNKHRLISPPDCNFEGLPSTLIVNYTITDLYALTPLVCQTACEDTIDYITTINSTLTSGSCLSYSFEAPAQSGFTNCALFSVPFNGQVDGIYLVIKDLV
jgi:hypothetical protein